MKNLLVFPLVLEWAAKGIRSVEDREITSASPPFLPIPVWVLGFPIVRFVRFSWKNEWGMR